MNTPTELHIALDLSLQSLNSNRKSNFKPQEKDWLLNETQLRIIDSIIDARKKEGYEDSVLNYDALKPLKKSVTLPVLNIDATSGYIELPTDYRHLDNAVCNLSVDCGAERETKAANVHKRAIVNMGNGATSPFYEDMGIYLSKVGSGTHSLFKASNFGHGSIYGNGFNNSETKYILINLILEEINKNNNNINVYWERYNQEYHFNSFIFIFTDNAFQDDDYININLYYMDYTTTSTIYDGTLFGEVPLTTNVYTKPLHLVSTEEVNEMLEHSFYTTSVENTLCTMNNNKLKVYYNSDFYISTVTLTYIKRPMMIDSIVGRMTELSNISDRIVQMTVQNIKAKIDDTGYATVINENLINN